MSCTCNIISMVQYIFNEKYTMVKPHIYILCTIRVYHTCGSIVLYRRVIFFHFLYIKYNYNNVNNIVHVNVNGLYSHETTCYCCKHMYTNTNGQNTKTPKYFRTIVRCTHLDADTQEIKMYCFCFTACSTKFNIVPV
jgi:hypothetical protein